MSETVSNAHRAFNAVFKELLVLIKCETGSKDIKNAVKSRYKTFDNDTADNVSAFLTEDDAIVDVNFSDIKDSLVDAEAVARFDAIIPVLRILAKLYSVNAAQCIVTSVYDAIDSGDVAALDGMILDAPLCDEIKAAVSGVDGETARAVKSICMRRQQDIMSIAKDVSKSIDINDLMKNGMDPNSSTMQSMIANVSRDIQGKIDSGDVNQEQLMKEATDLLASFGGSGGIGDMMKMMMSGMTTDAMVPPSNSKGKKF
jgi:hypothetical protein